MRPFVVRLFIVAAVTGLATCATVHYDAGPPADLTETLWLPPEAKLREDPAEPLRVVNGRSVYVDGSAAVAFMIEADRNEVTRRIVEHFAVSGLHQRRTQYLNPQLPTSFEGGWQGYGGGVFVGDPSEALRRGPFWRWHGEWEDDRGNILVYDIRGQGRELSGLASWVPRSMVERTRGVGGR